MIKEIAEIKYNKSIDDFLRVLCSVVNDFAIDFVRKSLNVLLVVESLNVGNLLVVVHELTGARLQPLIVDDMVLYLWMEIPLFAPMRKYVNYVTKICTCISFAICSALDSLLPSVEYHIDKAHPSFFFFFAKV